jgi:hypothetical protein
LKYDELLELGKAISRLILSLEFNDRFHDDGGRLLKLKNSDFSPEELVEVEILLKILFSKSLVQYVLESLLVDISPVVVI